MNIPFIEKEEEFKQFLSATIKSESISSYLTYLRNASRTLGEGILIADYETEDTLNDKLTTLSDAGLEKKPYSNIKSALNKYQEFASSLQLDEEETVIQNAEIEQTSNETVFTEVAHHHQEAFNFFKSTGTSKQQ